MLRKSLILGVVLVILCSGAVVAEKHPANPNGVVVKSDIVPAEKTGVIEVKAAEKGQKYPTVTLKSGEDVFRLIPAKGNKEFSQLEKMAGKQVTVKGDLMPANPPKYPLAAIKVASFVVVEEPAIK